MGINCFPMALMEKRKVDKNCPVSFAQGCLSQEQKATVLEQ